MNRDQALRRHLKFVRLFAGLVAVVLVLLVGVAPMLESGLEAREMEAPGPTALVFRMSHFVRSRFPLFAGLSVVVVGLAWSLFELFERRSRHQG